MKGHMILLVGPSGSGKSTFVQELMSHAQVFVHSMDAVRLHMYSEYVAANFEQLGNQTDIERYAAAFDYANTKPSEFDFAVNKDLREKATAHLDVIKAGTPSVLVIDNTNMGRKARTRYVTYSQHRKMNCYAVEFFNSLDTLLQRQNIRTDKSVPPPAVLRQFFAKQTVMADEVQISWVVKSDVESSLRPVVKSIVQQIS